MLDRCPFIINYDKFRVVNTVSHYFNGQKYELTTDGLHFIAESGNVLKSSKQEKWFNTTISIDCKDDVSSAIHLIPYLYRTLSMAVKVFNNIGKDLSYTFRIDTDSNEKLYKYPGHLQITNSQDKTNWEELNIYKVNKFNLSDLINVMLAFHPTNNKADIKLIA
jgi:hypothetical protein